MKIGLKKPSIKKSLRARTTGIIKRSIKNSINPLYGKKGKQSLYKYKEECKNIVCFSDEWYIFGGIKPLAPSTIGRRLKKYCELAGVKKIRIHYFRHSHASLLLSPGVPITVISQRFGHFDINMILNIY